MDCERTLSPTRVCAAEDYGGDEMFIIELTDGGAAIIDSAPTSCCSRAWGRRRSRAAPRPATRASSRSTDRAARATRSEPLGHVVECVQKSID